MEWFLSGVFVLIGILGWMLIHLYQSVLLRNIPKLTEQSRQCIFQLAKYLSIFFGLICALLRAPQVLFTNVPSEQWIVIFTLVWTLVSINLLRQFPKNSPLRRTTLISLLFIGLYTIGVGFEMFPSPLKFGVWFNDSSPHLQKLTSISLGLISAIFVHNIAVPVTLRLTTRSQTTIDDSLLSITQWPLSITVATIGINQAVAGTMNKFWSDTYTGLSLTIIIGLWTIAALKASSIILVELLHPKDKWQIVNQRTLPIFHLIFRLIIVTTSIYLLLIAWGVDVMFYITSAGVIGIAFAYASQDTLSSLFAGLAILSDAPYQLHDYLILDDGTRGRVTHIGFRSTRLMTMNNIEIIIPNSTMANAQIINMSGGETEVARIDCAAGVAYGSDIDQVRSLLLEIASQLDHVILDNDKYTPVVHFVSMGASSLDFVLRVWIDTPEHLLSIQDQANTLIYKTFQIHEIEIPYTKQDVYLYNMPTEGA